MKKIIYILVLSVVALSVSACSYDDAPEPVTIDFNNYSTAAPDQAAPPSPAQQNDVNISNMETPDKQENLRDEYSQAIIKTSLGNITVKLYGSDSPLTVNNFLNLAKAGFYDGTKFHRVIKDFMIQGGDPLSQGSDTRLYGTGGPGYNFKDEFNDHQLVSGSLAMANSGPNTNGSQFFIVTAEATPWLDGRHTNFGEVVSGLDIVKKIEATETGVNDRPLTDVVIESVELVK